MLVKIKFLSEFPTYGNTVIKKNSSEACNEIKKEIKWKILYHDCVWTGESVLLEYIIFLLIWEKKNYVLCNKAKLLISFLVISPKLNYHTESRHSTW